MKLLEKLLEIVGVFEFARMTTEEEKEHITKTVLCIGMIAIAEVLVLLTLM